MIGRARLPALLLVLAAWLTATVLAVPSKAVPRSGSMSGIALAEIHPGHGQAPYDEALDDIAALGAGWVLVPVYGFVDSVNAPGVSEGWEPAVTYDEYEAFVCDIVRAARDRGLAVALVPYLNIRRAGPGDWRGTLSPPNWPTWFASYERFLDRWVRVAAQEEAGLLAVGAELVSSERHASEWRALIRRVRTSYPGRLIYSSNWDHYRPAPFHAELDLVGLSGYYSLPHDAPSSPGAIDRLWRDVRDELLLFSREIDRPVLFTEIGYPSLEGAARHPWNYLAEGRADPDEQARGLESFARTWKEEPLLTGAFFWNWSPFRGGPLDRSYSLRDKPAAAIVRDWFDRHGSAPRHRKDLSIPPE